MDDTILDRIALAYEIEAIEGLEALGRPNGVDNAVKEQAMTAARRAFDIQSRVAIPDGAQERVFHVLHVSSLACCGGRWPELQKWLAQNRLSIAVPSVAEVPWDVRLLYRLFDCWVCLFRQESRDDLEQVCESIAGLRDEQEAYEATRLANGSTAEKRAVALRLIALYHWAKATEVLAQSLLEGKAGADFTGLDKHFESGITAAGASGDIEYEVILRWLYAAGRIILLQGIR